jgi:apolipoprotein N-acyltransferase
VSTREFTATPAPAGPARPLGIKILAISFALLGSTIFVAFVWTFWASSLTPNSRHLEDKDWLGKAMVVFNVATASGCIAAAFGTEPSSPWSRP